MVEVEIVSRIVVTWVVAPIVEVEVVSCIIVVKVVSLVVVVKVVTSVVVTRIIVAIKLTPSVNIPVVTLPGITPWLLLLSHKWSIASKAALLLLLLGTWITVSLLVIRFIETLHFHVVEIVLFRRRTSQ